VSGATAVTEPLGSPGGAPAVPRRGRPHPLEVLDSEWLKIRTLRSSFITLGLTLVAIVGLGSLICAIFRHQYDTNQLSFADLATFDSAFTTVSGVELAQFAVGVLGVLVITAEYGTGTIRTSLAAVPQRVSFLVAKAVVFSLAILLIGLIGAFSAFFLGEAILGLPRLTTTIGAPGVLRVVFGAALYLWLIGLFSLGLGALIRRTAGGVAAVFGLLLVLPIIVQLLPSPWNTDIHKYLPDQAGAAVLRTTVRAGLLSPWWGLALLAAYGAAAMIAGGAALVSRDA